MKLKDVIKGLEILSATASPLMATNTSPGAVVRES